jgi:hypothetical protein
MGCYQTRPRSDPTLNYFSVAHDITTLLTLMARSFPFEFKFFEPEYSSSVTNSSGLVPSPGDPRLNSIVM